jgi:autotransporter passenger strand-loop-strand repeat protein
MRQSRARLPFWLPPFGLEMSVICLIRLTFVRRQCEPDARSANGRGPCAGGITCGSELVEGLCAKPLWLDATCTKVKATVITTKRNRLATVLAGGIQYVLSGGVANGTTDNGGGDIVLTEGSRAERRSIAAASKLNRAVEPRFSPGGGGRERQIINA